MAKTGIGLRVHVHSLPAGKTFEFPEGTAVSFAGANGVNGGSALVAEVIRDGGVPSIPKDISDQVTAEREAAAEEAKKK